MAQKITVQLIDDTDGTEASETITFGLDGVEYEIDLNETNAAALRDALAPWVKAGRRTSSAPRRRRAAGSSGANGRSSETAAIRKWAQENGYEVSGRGRISAAIREAYAAAQ